MNTGTRVIRGLFIIILACIVAMAYVTFVDNKPQVVPATESVAQTAQEAALQRAHDFVDKNIWLIAKDACPEAPWKNDQISTDYGFRIKENLDGSYFVETFLQPTIQVGQYLVSFRYGLEPYTTKNGNEMEKGPERDAAIAKATLVYNGVTVLIGSFQLDTSIGFVYSNFECKPEIK